MDEKILLAHNHKDIVMFSGVGLRLESIKQSLIKFKVLKATTNQSFVAHVQVL